MIDASLRINIVNLFLRLKEEHGISFVYITHDLATAYYVSDQIAIMYRGSVVEHGPLDRVLGAPLHPYTELLLQSVPVFGEKWAGPIGLPDLETREYARAACKFAPRCPARRDVCARRTPPRFDGRGRPRGALLPTDGLPGGLAADAGATGRRATSRVP